MPVQIAAYSNCDDVLIYWLIEKPLKNCRGFALEREMKDAHGVTRSFVENRTGFASAPGQPGEHRASNLWPFQRFSWTDHKVNTGDTVRYRVTPVLSDGDGGLELDQSNQSDWTDWHKLSGNAGGGFECYFNRGLVISQFMSRYLRKLQDANGWTFTQALANFKKQIRQHEAPIRTFLSGELKRAMLDLLDEAKPSGGEVYAALFELGDDELINKLCGLKGRAHVVLADGSVKELDDDENDTARAKLKAAGVDVVDRMVCKRASGPLGHNKFLVLCKGGKPKAAWTGSTNWTPTGLCTQINNGLLVRDEGVAQLYMDQWDRLKAAGDSYPKILVDANSKVKRASVGGKQVNLWFTRTRDQVDLEALNAEIEKAEDAVLFLMFMPGPSGLLKTIRTKIKQSPKLYAHGVVSTLPDADDDTEMETATIGPSGIHRSKLDVVQPEGIKTPFASWAATVTRGTFTSQIGHAIVHSKLVVIDPFTNPVVITGSHNFSGAASKKNDENFIIIRGHKELAASYSAHILAVYQHYRWLGYVKGKQDAGDSPWSGLQDDDKWQSGHLVGANLRELKFWVG